MAKNPNHDWLDALSDGGIFRNMLALFVQVFLGTLYYGLIVAGFAAAIGLSFVLVGIPLLLFCLSATRTLADIDRRLMASVLNIDAPDTIDDLDLEGANIGERLGMLLGSGVTWRSLVYLALRLPIGALAITGLFMVLPFLALEMMILAPLGIDMRLLTPRLLRGLALVSYHAASWVLPTYPQIQTQPVKRVSAEKAKRTRLDRTDDPYEHVLRDDADYRDDDGDDARTFLDHDGELHTRRRVR
ncbi:MAG: sensor domain-containing protein [Chloroflexota bacterium]|nr:sensor domain-containing protein [Chloroflexota bacterium]